jgi:nicotinic acid mononucleotide adenylyltransferase
MMPCKETLQQAKFSWSHAHIERHGNTEPKTPAARVFKCIQLACAHTRRSFLVTDGMARNQHTYTSTQGKERKEISATAGSFASPCHAAAAALLPVILL